MATETKAKTQTIRPLEGYTRMSDQDVVLLAIAVYFGMTGNPRFSKPPADLIVLKTDADTLNALIAEAMDGSKESFRKRTGNDRS